MYAVLFPLKTAVSLLDQKGILIPDAGLEHEIEIERDKDSGECDNDDDALFFVGLPDAGQHKDTPSEYGFSSEMCFKCKPMVIQSRGFAPIIAFSLPVEAVFRTRKGLVGNNPKTEQSQKRRW